MDKYKEQELRQIAKARIDSYHKDEMYSGWARDYVEAEKPIPSEWRIAFYDELASDNFLYREKLEESVRWFGIRWIES